MTTDQLSIGMTVEDYFDTLTGFDDIAVKKRFGDTPVNLTQTDAITALRALVFVQYRRDGYEDDLAYDVTMKLPLKQVQGAFLDEPTDESGEGVEPSS
jgi:hypothetical protein